MAFTPKFVDLVRNSTSVQGTGPVSLGAAINGYAGFADVLTAGDQFYYCLQGVDKPTEREVGRGTMNVNGTIAREPIAGGLTNFSSGAKTIALVAAAEWYQRVDQAGASTAGAASVASRTALAAAGTGAAKALLLAEPGREGLFVFSTANLAAQVALDPRQGILVAPASDPTGASGAWVRKFDGPVHVDWFGAVGDDVANDGPAVVAALDFLDQNRIGYSGAQTLRFGAKNYYLGTSQLNIRTTLVVEGAGMRATQLRWAANSKGIVVQRLNTADGTTVGGENLGAGDNSIIRQMTLAGAWTGAGGPAEGEYHGVELRARATLSDLEIKNWQGDGIFSRCVAGSAGVNEGNSNVAQIVRVVAHHNRNGLYCDGPDANVWNVIGGDYRENRRWGIWDSSFLGNCYVGWHTASNGADGVWGVAGVPRTNCKYGVSNYTYFVARDQGAGAKLNPPTGTTASNTWWIYNPMGGYAEAWSGTLDYRDGGSFRSDDANACITWTGGYSESGQSPAQLAGRDLVLGGMHLECGLFNELFQAHGGWLRGTGTTLTAAGRLDVVNALDAKGNDNFVGPDGSRPAYNATFTLRTTGSYNSLSFYHVGVGQAAYLFSQYGAGLTINGNGKTALWVNEAACAEFDTAGLNLVAGKSYRINGVKLALGDLNDVASGSVAYRKSAGAGAWETQTLATLKADLGLAAVATSGSASDLTAGTLPVAQTAALTGDVTKAAGASATTIAAGAVTTAKMANLAAASLLGNPTGASAAPAAVTLGGGVEFSAGALQTSAFTGDVTKAAGGTVTTIGAGAVTLAKMANLAANSILGNNTGAGATPIALSGTQTTAMLDAMVGANGTVAGTKGLVPQPAATDNLKFLTGAATFAAVDLGTANVTGTLAAARFPALTGDVTTTAGGLATTIAASAVTYAKMQNVTASRLLGNPTGSAAAPSEISLAGGLAFSGTTLTAAGALTPTSVAATGAVTSSGATSGVGYATGAGGTVTQLTSKSTGVTLNKASGQITMNAASLAASAVVSFTVTNSAVAASDTINLNLASGNATAGTYRYWIDKVAAGSFVIAVENRSAGALGEALVLNFAVIKGASA